MDKALERTKMELVEAVVRKAKRMNYLCYNQIFFFCFPTFIAVGYESSDGLNSAMLVFSSILAVCAGFCGVFGTKPITFDGVDHDFHDGDDDDLRDDYDDNDKNDDNLVVSKIKRIPKWQKLVHVLRCYKML